MKVAYVTLADPSNIYDWSGTPYFIRQALSNQSISLEHIGSLQESLVVRGARRAKRYFYNLFNQRYIKDSQLFRLRSFAEQISRQLTNSNADVVLSAPHQLITYVECSQPLVFWADATFSGMLNYYPGFMNLCQESIHNGHLMERRILQNSQLAIYSSDWAAQTAIQSYQADPAKVKVVPFGANFDSHLRWEQVKEMIEARPGDRCKLLFLGVEWHRKGGDTAFQVARALNRAGLPTELTIVGCQPEIEGTIPDYVKPLGFISKSTPEGREKLARLFAESHFLIVPSLAECFGLVFCEANSFGVPALATHTGGIPTIIKDDINGKLFEVEANIPQYCQYIQDLFCNYSNYQSLAGSSFFEYESRLNWRVAGQQVRNLLTEVFN